MARYKSVAKTIIEHEEIIQALLVRDYCPSDFVSQAYEGCSKGKFCPIIFGHDSEGCKGCWNKNMVGWEHGAKGYVELPKDLLENLPKPHGDTKPKSDNNQEEQKRVANLFNLALEQEKNKNGK